MKDKRACSVLKSLLAAVLVVMMAFSMTTFIFADEETDTESTDSSGSASTTDSSSGTNTEEVAPYAPAETVTPEGGAGSSKVSVVGFYRSGRYADYYAEHESTDTKMPEILADGSQVTAATAPYTNEATYEGRSNVLVMGGEGNLTYTLNVAQTGMYALELNYFPLLGDGNGKDYELSVLVDGSLPYSDADRFTLKRNWTDEDVTNKFDSAGNELYSKQVESAKWLSKDIRDPDGVYDTPIKFYLTEGVHTITLSFASGLLALDSLRMHNDGTEVSYQDYLNKYDALGAAEVNQDFTLEAENYLDKSEALIQPAYDRSDPKVTPYSISKTRLNVLGGDNWSTSGQTVNWTIDAPQDGYYSIGVRYRQSYTEDATSYRRIYIDGQVPYEEMNAVGFPFGVGYHYKLIGGTDVNGDAFNYKFYLTAGKHTFSMEAVIGPMAQVSRDTEDIVYQLNYVYRKIIMVTGSDPDTYRDYQLDSKVPGLEEMLTSVLTDLQEVGNQVTAINGSLGSATIITTLDKQLSDFIDQPYSIPDRLSTFKDNISTLSAWMLKLRSQPLQIDKLVFTGEGMKPARQTANAFENISHEVRAFASSFLDDYTTVGSASSNGRSLTVWVGTGRDQAMVLKTLCDNYFTPDTDIAVNVSLVPLNILSKAIIAGRGPDIALHVSRSEPMNLGVRNAIYDLSQFSDYQEITQRFTKYAMVPYMLSTTTDIGEQINKVFALPETQNFNMMFYRTDIFSELGISAPNTWDETILYRIFRQTI